MDNKIITNNLLYKSPSLKLYNNLYKNNFTGCCMAFNRKILNKALPFPKNIPMHDWWIGIIGLLYGNVKFIEEPLIYYRKHSNNITNTGGKSKNSLAKIIHFRMILIRSLINHLWKRIACLSFQ